jgi:hypothetical protein
MNSTNHSKHESHEPESPTPLREFMQSFFPEKLDARVSYSIVTDDARLGRVALHETKSPAVSCRKVNRNHSNGSSSTIGTKQVRFAEYQRNSSADLLLQSELRWGECSSLGKHSASWDDERDEGTSHGCSSCESHSTMTKRRSYLDVPLTVPCRSSSFSPISPLKSSPFPLNHSERLELACKFLDEAMSLVQD